MVLFKFKYEPTEMDLVYMAKPKIETTPMIIVIHFVELIVPSNPHSYVLDNDHPPFLKYMYLNLSLSFNLLLLFLVSCVMILCVSNIKRIPHSHVSLYLICISSQGSQDQ